MDRPQLPQLCAWLGMVALLVVGCSGAQAEPTEAPAPSSPKPIPASNRQIFDLTAGEKALVVGTHFCPFPSLGTVAKRGEGWQWNPLETAPAETDPGSK